MATNLPGLLPSNIYKPPFVVIHGPQGVGKSTFGADGPNPVFLMTEDGRGIIDVPGFRVEAYDDMMKHIGTLLDAEHDFQTVVLDSADHLEPIIWAETCKVNNWPSIEHEAYGKGYLAALEPWREVLAGLDALRTERNMAIVVTAHSEVKRFNSPTSDPYDRYRIKLQDRASALLQESADAVLFAKVQEATTEVVEGKGRSEKRIRRGVSGGKRILYTEERPAFLAKNRYDLPAEMPLKFAAFSEHVPFYNRDLGAAERA